MSEPFDIEAARIYAGRPMQPDDSYHAWLVLEACDEIDRLVAALREIIDYANGRGPEAHEAAEIARAALDSNTERKP